MFSCQGTWSHVGWCLGLVLMEREMENKHLITPKVASKEKLGHLMPCPYSRLIRIHMGEWSAWGGRKLYYTKL